MAKKPALTEALRFDMPYGSAPLSVASQAVGIARIVRRSGGTVTRRMTVLDTEDCRLLRSGVTMAHRVLDGRGEWYLSAPKWAPHLPDERVAALGARGELPIDFAQVVCPLTRGVDIAPIATLTSECDEWVLRDEAGDSVALVTDERVRIDGMSATNYRQVTVAPSNELTGQQRDFIFSAAAASHATFVERFPSLQQRLGPPATGLSSFLRPRATRPDVNLEEFVTNVFSEHLDEIVRADLDRRTGDDGEDVGALNARLWGFGRDLRGLAPVLEPAWRERIERDLAGLPFGTARDIEPPTLRVIEALVGGVRAPRLGDLSLEPAARVLIDRAEHASHILGDRCRSLSTESSEGQWQAALRAAEQLEVAASVAAPLLPKGMKKLSRHLDDIVTDLRRCTLGSFSGSPELDGLSAMQAYQLGLDAGRIRSNAQVRRAAFIAQWPERSVAARKLLQKAKAK